MIRKNLYSVLLILAIGTLSYNCGGDDGGLGATCSPVTDLCNGADIQACCTQTSCYYNYNGQRYNCNGFDCNAAAQEVVDDACGSARLDAAEKGAKVNQLLLMTNETSE